MLLEAGDRRVWTPTDRAGERLTLARPVEDVEVLSVRDSNRYWREAHSSFTLALIHPAPTTARVEWRTRGRTFCTEGGGLMAIEPGDMHVTHRLHLQKKTASFDVLRFAPSLASPFASLCSTTAAGACSSTGSSKARFGALAAPLSAFSVAWTSGGS
jgi:hypothetical protein